MGTIKSGGNGVFNSVTAPVLHNATMEKSKYSAGVWSNFEFVITGEEVEKGKPHPDIFLKACERAGIPPRRALVLEDSVNGGLAAKAAGIRYIIVPDMKAPTDEVATSAQAVVHSLFDVLTFL